MTRAGIRALLPDGVTPPGTRGRILYAALELFAEFGFHGTSIRDLAKRVGINSATLYSHYPSKEDVLAELVALGHVGHFNALQHALAAAGEHPSEQLVALMRAQVFSHTDFPLLATVANNELHALSAPKAAPSLALRDQGLQMLYSVLRRGVELGEFIVTDVVLAGTAMASMGLRVASWFGPDQPYTREQVADNFADFALRIVGGKIPGCC
jgi:AcrR family transcriptional regulator